MGKIMEKFNKLTLPAVILIASVILGALFFATQVIKQQSIEKQQQIKIKQEKWDQLAKELKEQQGKGEAKQAKHQNVLLLETCLDNAEKSR